MTSGCSHNKCSYCSIYKNIPFKIESLEQIEKDLIEAKKTHINTERIYLLNGDPFSLSADRLKSKELKELRALGINDLYIGVETGLDESLKRINKGNTSKEAKEELQRLNEASIDFISIIMYGVAGRGKGTENALANANLLNSVRSKAIALMNLTLIPDTDLYEEAKRGDFIEASEKEKLIEEKP